MKKLFTLTLLFASIGIATFTAEAKTAKSATLSSNSNIAEYSAQPGRWRNRQRRVTTRVRIVRYGRYTYREVWRYTYFGNGRVQTRLISRTRIR